jgi:dTDP-4-dehydrorhamnose 3,5-epimerase-like enzyme
VAWNDPSLDLRWPIEPPILSARDAAAPTLAEIDLDAAFEPRSGP